ncbi:hypothetical protein BU24DRAFT_467703 [Aaosphaeria arxii CBS 175.79]|uniref:Chitin-binding type-4 domain-containing protein n=1 Tax=Aaosphaeria arxii CBS 175.79 TaxID=1450172 RepID=A0A6A5XB85_9PLEO|nr:uncharacterized protein BU24DRAFT_467703 [Aaosphaeria arxii CBS 175.79]KAF2010232.1 hypothetical protein BU24DRAFT_467703 [Aaosphaeria arxii CBS 175.79]
MYTSTFISTALFAATVLAHGNITSPPARQPGPAMAQACGAASVSAILADGTGPLENIPSNGSPNCNIFLCKGAQFADNAALVQTLSPGSVVPFTAELPIPHEGPANVSIVDTATNSILFGVPLLEFDSYADENLAVLPANNTAFEVTLPTATGGRCETPGECVLQWFWFGTNAGQTYENCVDFVFA